MRKLTETATMKLSNPTKFFKRVILYLFECPMYEIYMKDVICILILDAFVCGAFQDNSHIVV